MTNYSQTENLPLNASKAQNPLSAVTSFLLFIAMLSSGFVLFEPAPFDLLILTTIFVAFVNDIKFPAQIKWVIFFAAIHLIGSFLGVIMSERVGDSQMHVIITAYMILFAIGLIILVYDNPHKTLKIIMIAYVGGALITTLLAIMGYFHIGSTYDLFTLYGRAKGGFKDPNVFGPFIIPPLLYLMEKVISKTSFKKIIPLVLFSFLMIGLLLSFSRGAWGGFFFASLMVFASLYYCAPNNRYRVKLSLIIFVAIFVMLIALVIAVNIPAISVIFDQRASLSQSYDVDDGGRFSNHLHAFNLLVERPWGIGAKEFGWTYGEDVHNSYLTTFLIGGWIGGFSFIFIILATLVAGFKYCFMNFSLRLYFIVFYASFFSLAIEAWIIDIDHWRLLYVLIGCIWGIIFYQKYNIQSKSFEPQLQNEPL